MRAPRSTRLPSTLASTLATTLAMTALLLGAFSITPTAAAAFEFEGSGLETAIAGTLDAAIVRPLASARVLIGGILFIPAALLSSPGGKEHFDTAYDLLLAEPMEFAFERKLGEF